MSNTENNVIAMMAVSHIQHSINSVASMINQRNAAAGWWTNIATGESLLTKAGEPPKRNVPEALMLIVTEVSEAMEGFRKGIKDDHLPHRDMLEVELADALIRILDLAGGTGMDIGGAVAEKLEYNMTRADHKIENRLKDGGKKA